MNPIAKYAIAVLVVLGALFGAYQFGASVTQTKADLAIAKLNGDIADQRTAHEKARGDLVAAMREKDRANADAMAAIDAQHQKEIADHEAISNRTIADLRSGAVSLRDKFTTCQRTAASGSAQAGTSTGSGNDPASIQLQVEDAQLLILWATEADRVADQLRAAQAIIAADRKGQSKP